MIGVPLTVGVNTVPVGVMVNVSVGVGVAVFSGARERATNPMQ